MWSTADRFMNISGTVRAAKSGAPPQPLGGVAVDVYRFEVGALGEYQFDQVNSLPAITGASGTFAFTDLTVSVPVQTVIPSTPPYEPIELVQPNSLPNLVFRISAPVESLFVEVYDERTFLDADWVVAHPQRLHVALTGSAPFVVEAPDYVPVTWPPGKEFHFLRVGRAVRDEIGELGEARPDYVDYQGKPGYMVSSNVRTANVEPSFFPGQIDAPFGSTLQVGGHFGAALHALANNLYYSASYWQYSGDPALPFNPTQLVNEVPVEDALFNKYYDLPTVAQPKGKWHTLNLGSFTGTITAVEAPHPAGLIGAPVTVYRWPGLPNPATEYWPFPDLILIWNSSAAPAGLVILTLEVYERVGGTETSPALKKLAMDSPASVNRHLPLHIDNRPPKPTFLPYDALDPDQRKFHTAYARFIGVPEQVGTYDAGSVWHAGTSEPMHICNELSVQTGQTNGNECILVRYSVEDGAGNPHQHVRNYSLGAQYTPKAVPGAPDSTNLALKAAFSGFQAIAQSYSPAAPPTMQVNDFPSVIVPANADSWPPEPSGDTVSPSQCPQYALEVSLGASVRTVNGWSRLFSRRYVSRHIIIKRT